MEIYGYNFQSFHKCFLCGAAAGVLGRCFLKRGSPVGHSDDASWSAEALSDTRTMLPEARKLPEKRKLRPTKNKIISCYFIVNFLYLPMFNLKNE